VQRLGVGIRLALEVLGPRSTLLRLLGADVRINVLWPATAATTAPATIPAAGATVPWSATTTTTALTASAATSISVLHSL